LQQNAKATTRKDSQDSKIKTRAMTSKANEKKISLVEAKRKSRQRMVKVKDSAAGAVKDIYGNVSELETFIAHFNCHVIFFVVRRHSALSQSFEARLA